MRPGETPSDAATASTLPTTVVGSYPQPDWLIDRDALLESRCRGVRAPSSGGCREPTSSSRRRTTPPLLAIRDMERAGIDIITDGEMRRESYSNRFATALEGIDIEHPGEVIGAHRRAHTGAARRRADPPARARWRCATWSSCAPTPTAQIKITLPGPFTMTQQAQNDYYTRRGRAGDGLRRGA